jgi:crotonobetaine/carnitine-CoA ligase
MGVAPLHFEAQGVVTMHAYADFFPHRIADDALDTAPLIHAGLLADDAGVRVSFEGRSLSTGALRQRVASLQAVLAEIGLLPGRTW